LFKYLLNYFLAAFLAGAFAATLAAGLAATFLAGAFATTLATTFLAGALATTLAAGLATTLADDFFDSPQHEHPHLHVDFVEGLFVVFDVLLTAIIPLIIIRKIKRYNQVFNC
jgi:ABC-type uncharacterized transport system permease subunit